MPSRPAARQSRCSRTASPRTSPTLLPHAPPAAGPRTPSRHAARQSRPKDAIKACSAALEVQPNHAAALITRAKAYEHMGFYKQALADASAAAAVNGAPPVSCDEGAHGATGTAATRRGMRIPGTLFIIFSLTERAGFCKLGAGGRFRGCGRHAQMPSSAGGARRATGQSAACVSAHGIFQAGAS
eukprot:357161-Chlamydomonas_euryale.AAC.4